MCSRWMYPPDRPCCSRPVRRTGQAARASPTQLTPLPNVPLPLLRYETQSISYDLSTISSGIVGQRTEITGLTPNSNYTFYLVAINREGNSERGAGYSLRTLGALPLEVEMSSSQLGANTTNNSAIIEWIPPQAYNLPIESYTLQLCRALDGTCLDQSELGFFFHEANVTNGTSFVADGSTGAVSRHLMKLPTIHCACTHAPPCSRSPEDALNRCCREHAPHHASRRP